MLQSQELSLKELWLLLSEKEDITITVDIVKTEYVRKGLAKLKNREREKLGEFADPTLRFKVTVLEQNSEEREAGTVRIRLQLTRQEGFVIHEVQVNDVNEFDDSD
jgi:hypothetical protein